MHHGVAAESASTLNSNIRTFRTFQKSNQTIVFFAEFFLERLSINPDHGDHVASNEGYSLVQMSGSKKDM